MKKTIKFIFGIFLFFYFIFSVSKNISAQESQEKFFANTLQSSYTVQTNGDTLVQHTFTIENLTPTYYISRHGLRISSPSITSVRVSDSGGEIPAEVTHTDNQTNIGITFDDQLVGEGKSRTFTITYLNPDLAQINGQVLEVAVPKQADASQYDSVTVTLATPLNYGQPTRVTPSDNFVVNHSGNQIRLTFSNLHGEGVSAIYGWQQIFAMDFKYFLENNDSQPVLLQVALPPDTPYQRMNYESIDPKPREIELDEDGNWIATFYMGGNTAQTVSVSAMALLTIEPNGMVPVSPPQQFHVLPQPYWEITDPNIKELAAQYTTPSDIYNYVTNNLEYAEVNSVEDLQRLGAASALENPELAVCQEFSDLFVALARANNIPARVVSGYAHTNNSALRPLSLVDDILHAWPEYWNEEKQLWQPVDPTWGNTTGGVDYFNQFDLNHIVLAINGRSSTLPYPAGSYKTADHQEKSLEVEFATLFPNQQPDVSAKVLPRETAVSTLPGFYEVKLDNPTGAAWYDISFELSAENSQIRTFGNNQLSALLPYQSATVPIFVYNTQGGWPAEDQLHVKVLVGERTVSEQDTTITNAPYFVQYIARPYVIIGLGAGFILLALGAGSLLVLRRKK